MTLIQNFLTQPACQALGWALLHFLWQGTLAALLLAACNYALRGFSARVRYAVSCFFLLLLLALPVLTFTAGLNHAPPLPARLAALQPAALLPIATVAPVLTHRSLQDALTPFIPWIVILWIAGVALLSIRWIGAWSCLRRFRRAASLTVPPEWERALLDLLRRAAVSTPVRLSIHSLPQAPCVIGWLRPVILMPAASLAGLDWRALEALLAHEIAHIRRHDYLVNLLQTVVDTLLFYHPAVWWISCQIRIERENCCDDFAARLCGDRIAYARALIDLEHIRAGEPAFAMSARGGSLLHRIQRLLDATAPEPRRAAWIPALAGMAVLAGLALTLHSPAHAARTMPRPQTALPAPLLDPRPPAPRKPVTITRAAAQDNPEPAAAAPAQHPPHDFLTGIVAAGFRNLSVAELIDLKIHGVTPEFAAGVKQAGYSNVTARELVEMAIHGVTLDYIRDMQSAIPGDLSIAALVSLRIHGVDSDFIKHLNNNGIKNLPADKLIRLKQSGF